MSLWYFVVGAFGGVRGGCQGLSDEQLGDECDIQGTIHRMKTTKALEAKRVGRREFVQRVARRAGISVLAAQTAYDAMIDELLDLAGRGESVTLTNFGRFYPQTHKGHRVQFAKQGGGGEVADYTVLKFSATRAVNRRVKVDDATAPLS